MSVETHREESVLGSTVRGETVRLPIPAEILVTALVYHPSEAARGLDRADVLAIILAWLEAHAREPLLGAVRGWIESGRLGLGAAASKELPVPPAFAYCPDCRKHERYPDIRSLDSCVLLSAEDSPAPPRPGLWAVIAASEALSEELGGVIWSPELKIPRPRDRGWRTLPPDGAVRAASHIWFTSSFDERMRGWVTSCGMARFGLPEIEAVEVPPGLGPAVSRLLGAIAQVLIRKVEEAAVRSPSHPFQLELESEPEVTAADLAEAERAREGRGEGRGGGGNAPRPEGPAGTDRGRDRDRKTGTAVDAGANADTGSVGDPGRRPGGDAGTVPGAKRGSGATRVRLTLPVDSSGKSRFLRVCAPRSFDEGHGVFLQEAIRAIVPGEEDRIEHCSEDDPEMEEAHRRAIARLEEVKRRFRVGLGIGVTLLVESLFR